MNFFKSSENEQHLFKEFFLKYNRTVFLFISHKIADRDDALDVTQNVFIHLWKYRRELKDDTIDKIIFKTCNQEISSYYLLKKKQNFYKNDVDLNNISDETQENLDLMLLKEQRITDIYSWIELLPDKRKKIFMMNKIEKITQEQIAMEMGMSKAAVSKQIIKAMLFLKQKLR